MASRIYDAIQLSMVPAFGSPLRGGDAANDHDRRADSSKLDEERRQLREERAQLAVLQKRYLERIEQIADLTRTLGRPSASAVVDLAMVVARELIGREVDVDRQILVTGIEEGLQQVAGHERVQVRLGKADLDAVAALRPDLKEKVELVADDSLPPGGCVIESSRSVIDRSLGPRLDAVRTALLASLEKEDEDVS